MRLTRREPLCTPCAVVYALHTLTHCASASPPAQPRNEVISKKGDLYTQQQSVSVALSVWAPTIDGYASQFADKITTDFAPDAVSDFISCLPSSMTGVPNLVLARYPAVSASLSLTPLS